MPTIFGVDVQAIVAQNIGPGVFSATLTKVTNGVYDVNNPTSGIGKSTASYPCKVVFSKTILSHNPDDLTRTLSGKITVLLGTLPKGIVPSDGDSFVATPPGWTSTRTFVVSDKVDIDAAAATATCDVQGTP